MSQLVPHRKAFCSALMLALILSVRSSRAETPALSISIVDMPAVFSPNPAQIKAGQAIKWTNDGDTVHTVTTDASQAPDPNWVSVPSGASSFDSGYLKSGESFVFTFTVPGVYKYFCLTHEEEGMRGEVHVLPGPGSGDAGGAARPQN